MVEGLQGGGHGGWGLPRVCLDEGEVLVCDGIFELWGRGGGVKESGQGGRPLGGAGIKF
jgi:hypothetical protein